MARQVAGLHRDVADFTPASRIFLMDSIPLMSGILMSVTIRSAQVGLWSNNSE